jgi:hypothetical protein
MPPGQPDKAVVQASDVPLDMQAAIAEYAASMGYGPRWREGGHRCGPRRNASTSP